ncbi:MAG: type II toxin-antitoxin system VapC family toxin [Bacteroidales bacterium]|nr:type II toxin-antitoxin system VapC family toxin [Bacteroidales bacterium]
MYLLDTNVWVALLRKTSQKVATRFQTIAPTGSVRTCSIVVAELRYGAIRSAKATANRAAIDALLRPFPQFSFDDATADHFADIKRQLETLGTPIGPYDLQIAAIAQQHGCTLVTHNTTEFGRITGLAIEDWES